MSRAHVLSTEDIIRMKRFLKEGDYWEALGLAPGATMRRIATRAARLEAACQEDDEAKRWVRMARGDLEHQRGYEAARLIRDEACRELQEKFGPFVFDRLPVEEVWRIVRFGIPELPDASLEDQIRAAVMGRVPPLPEVELRLEQVLAGRAEHQLKETGCPICGGEGVIEQEVTVGDRRFGLPARCECVREVVFEIPRGVRVGWIIRTENGEREYAAVSTITGEVAVPPRVAPVPPPRPTPATPEGPASAPAEGPHPAPPSRPAPAPPRKPAPVPTAKSTWSLTALLRALPRLRWAWPAILLAVLAAAGAAGGFMALAQVGGSRNSQDDGGTVPAMITATSTTTPSLVAPTAFLDSFHFDYEVSTESADMEVTLAIEGDFKTPDSSSCNISIGVGDLVVEEHLIVIDDMAWIDNGSGWRETTASDPDVVANLGWCPGFRSFWRDLSMQRPPLAGDRETKNGIPAIHHSLVEGDGGLAGLALIPQDLEGVSVETLDIWLAEDGGWVVGLDVEMYADAEASDELAELMAGMDSVSIAVRISITQPNDRGIRVTAPVSSSSGPSAQPAVPLKIALLVPYTGVLSDFGIAFERSAELAVKEINQAGGVLGEAVALVTGDSATDPVTAQEEARRLVEVERVSAVVGAAASGVTLPVAESVTVPSRILQISPSATSPALTSFADGDYLFRTYISDAAQGVILAGLARARGFTSACTMYVNNAYGEGLSEQFTESFEELGGTVTVQVSHAAEEQISYLSEVNECVQGNPDVLAAISYPEHGQVYLREALEAGLIDRFIFVDGTKSDRMFRALGWANFEGMYGTAPGGLATVPGTAFTASYEAEYGEKPPLPFMRESYDAVYVIALAAAKANSTDSTAIRDALRDIANPPGEVVNPGVGGFRRALELIGAGTDIDYQGTSGPIDFDQNGDVLQGAIEEWRIGGGEIVDAVRTFEVNLGTTPPTVTEVTR